MRDNRWVALVVALGALALAGCGTSEPRVAHEVVTAGNPDYALRLLRTTPTGDENRPADLKSSLPNHHYRVGGTSKPVSYSDAVVVGSVTQVRKGNGVVWRGDHDFTLVDYDDAKADTRSALVTVSIDRSAGALLTTARTVTFRVLAPTQADAERFIQGLAGLQRIAVVLHRDPNAAETTPWRPILGDRLIGIVGADGSLSWPALPRGSAFPRGLDSADALMRAAKEPITIQHQATP